MRLVWHNWTGAIAGLLTACIVVGAAHLAAADDALRTAAKKILEQHKDAVVWVSAVARINFTTDDAKGLSLSLPEREQKYEARGTVIGTDGLTVTALSLLDPSSQISGRTYSTAAGQIKIDAAVTLKEVKIIMPDGTELPADVVMKDSDLDLAFIRPKPDAKELKGVVFKPVELTNNTTADVADDVVTVSRTDEALNRQPAVERGHVVALTRKPRVFMYATGTEYGCPTFAPDGKLLGITVNRFAKDKPPQPVILPASDVHEIAAQAKAAKAPDSGGASGRAAPDRAAGAPAPSSSN
ncbi:MAG: serine protease [Verrucomicrobiales bacterium]|nr:serine protease [Verrucomicrobiales bacterium]